MDYQLCIFVILGLSCGRENLIIGQKVTTQINLADLTNIMPCMQVYLGVTHSFTWFVPTSETREAGLWCAHCEAAAYRATTHPRPGLTLDY